MIFDFRSGEGGSVPNWIPGTFNDCISKQNVFFFKTRSFGDMFSCLEPETVAEAVLFIVEQMDHAVISEINLTANTKIKE